MTPLTSAMAAIAAAKKGRQERKADERKRAVDAGVPVAPPLRQQPVRIAAWLIVALLVVNFGRGLINELTFDLVPDIPAPLTSEDEFSLTQPVPIEIVSIEPIALECRATIDSVIALVLQKDVEYRVFGWGWGTRSEHGFYTAYGDIDVCVGIENSTITSLEDVVGPVLDREGWLVEIAVNDLEFRRPRIDNLKSAQSWRLHTDWGWVPGIDGDTTMGVEATALAQLLVGSSECIEAAFEATKLAITESYKQQALDVGIDPAKVEVRFTGEPNYDGYVEAIMSMYEAGTRLWVEELLDEYGFVPSQLGDENFTPIACRLHEDLVQPIQPVPVSPDSDLASP